MSTIQQVTAADWKQLGRSERRQGVRRAMARLELLQSRCRVLENQSRDLNGRVDRAADAHARTCGPLQERLARIEEEMAVHLADRTPVPSELEAERVQLLNEIADANICLERETEIVRKQQNKLE